MGQQTLSLLLQDQDATSRAAVTLARTLNAGDVILLEGDVGAGKTHFARSLIQSVLTSVEDVPSPTFTLVQTYDTTKGEVWHADLYRLTDTREIEELGLTDAFETAICLIEWPDRLGPLKPASALSLTLASTQNPDARQFDAQWQHPKWNDKIAGWTT